jgi:hypothetical protein
MFRFTIRDVLWLTVMVTLAVGWCLDHRTQGAERLEAVGMAWRLESFLGQEGYKVTWTFDNDVVTILRPGEH